MKKGVRNEKVNAILLSKKTDVHLYFFYAAQSSLLQRQENLGLEDVQMKF